jgi:hypothetical protein
MHLQTKKQELYFNYTKSMAMEKDGYLAFYR